MKLLVLLLVAVAVCAEARSARSRRRSYRDEYEYDYWGRRRPAYPSYPEDSSEEEDDDDTVYRFHLAEDDYGGYLYHDEEGYAHGFEIDLLQEVCKQAGKKCYFTLDKSEHCWYNEGGHELPGIGLLAGWFDGCMGWFPTVERKNSFDFANSFTRNMRITIWYLPSVLNKTSDHDLTNRKIGFVRGFAGSQACLNRQSDDEWRGQHLGDYTAVVFETYKEMLAAAMNDEVDGIVGPAALNLDTKGFSHTEPYLTCTTDGASVMFRYGSDALNWWNKAFDELVDSGDFRDLCRRSSRAHADKGELHCDI